MPSRASSVRPNPSDPQLPKEIIDDIIDYLADDVAALRAFALTGRTLLHRARMHLFACITLEGGPAFLDRGVTPGRKFLALVRESPYLLGYIKEVRVLNLNEAWMDDWVGCDLALGFSIGVFLRTLEARLPEVGAGVGAGVVSGVQLVPPPSVSLRSVVLERIDWQEIPGGHRVSLEDLVVFPTVKDVTLKQIRGMSWETCERFPAGLEKLWLFAVDFFPLVEADSDTDDGWDTSDDEQDDVIVDASGDGIKRQTAERRGFRVLLPTTRSKQTFPSLRALAIHRGSLGRDASLIFAKNTFFPLLVSDLRAFLTSSWSEREWRHNKEILARIIPMNLLESFGLGFCKSLFSFTVNDEGIYIFLQSGGAMGLYQNTTSAPVPISARSTSGHTQTSTLSPSKPRSYGCTSRCKTCLLPTVSNRSSSGAASARRSVAASSTSTITSSTLRVSGSRETWIGKALTRRSLEPGLRRFVIFISGCRLMRGRRRIGMRCSSIRCR